MHAVLFLLFSVDVTDDARTMRGERERNSNEIYALQREKEMSFTTLSFTRTLRLTRCSGTSVTESESTETEQDCWTNYGEIYIGENVLIGFVQSSTVILLYVYRYRYYRRTLSLENRSDSVSFSLNISNVRMVEK